VFAGGTNFSKKRKKERRKRKRRREERGGRTRRKSFLEDQILSVTFLINLHSNKQKREGMEGEGKEVKKRRTEGGKQGKKG
jgi:hypothetical protein